MGSALRRIYRIYVATAEPGARCCRVPLRIKRHRTDRRLVARAARPACRIALPCRQVQRMTGRQERHIVTGFTAACDGLFRKPRRRESA